MTSFKRGKEHKPHVGFYGRCNTGKSSFVNFLTGTQASLVSEVAGVTTDPVRKHLELLDFAPIVLIDTAGFDDASDLGEARTVRSIDTLMQVDLAVMLFSHNRWEGHESRFMNRIVKAGVPCLLVHNVFEDERLDPRLRDRLQDEYRTDIVEINVLRGGGEGRDRILERIKQALPEHSYIIPSLFGDSVRTGDLVVLVCPVDGEAPAGRLVLPQVQAIRDLLDRKCTAVVLQPGQLEGFLRTGAAVRLVVTDSQVIDRVQRTVPADIPVTSFSILLARLKGDPATYAKGLEAIGKLREGDRILMLENCLHQVNCEDIGRRKIPAWLKEYTGKDLEFSYVSGLSPLPDDLREYALAVQCGGCMVTRRQLMNRIRTVAAAGVPITNYGMLIRKIKG